MTKEQTMAMYEKVSDLTGYKANEIAVISKQIAKGAEATELAYFLNVCKTVGLSPFNKEIWCYKDNKGNLIIFTGRDGLLANAQKRPEFNGIRSVEFCENDSELMIDIPNGKIVHQFDPRKDRGKILGAYSIIFRKDGEPTIEVADFKTYNKGYNTWKTHPAEMIKKVSEAHALKKAFGMSGVQVEYDWDVSPSGVATPIETIDITSEVDKINAEIVERLDVYQGEDKTIIQELCVEKKKAGEFTIEFGKQILKQLGSDE